MQSVSLLRRQRHGRWGAGARPHRVERGCDPSRAQWLLRNACPPNARRKYVRLKLVGRVAQVVEQRPFKAWVAGSNPAALTNPPRPAFPRRSWKRGPARGSLPYLQTSIQFVLKFSHGGNG